MKKSVCRLDKSLYLQKNGETIQFDPFLFFFDSLPVYKFGRPYSGMQTTVGDE